MFRLFFSANAVAVLLLLMLAKQIKLLLLLIYSMRYYIYGIACSCHEFKLHFPPESKFTHDPRRIHTNTHKCGDRKRAMSIESYRLQMLIWMAAPNVFCLSKIEKLLSKYFYFLSHRPPFTHFYNLSAMIAQFIHWYILTNRKKYIKTAHIKSYWSSSHKIHIDDFGYKQQYNR